MNKMDIKKTVILVSGYRGMGKDYVSQHGLSAYEIFFKSEVSKRKLSILLSSLGRVPIFKFAEPLKNLLGPFMGLSSSLIEQYDLIKDVQNKLPYNGTIRDYFIGIGGAVRAVDNDFFVKRTTLAIEQCKDDVVIVSDWRYPNELDYLKKHFNVITLRVHRVVDSDGKFMSIPDKEVTSERSLDKTETDFFVWPRDNLPYYKQLFGQIDELFPQYTTYKLLTTDRLI